MKNVIEKEKLRTTLKEWAHNGYRNKAFNNSARQTSINDLFVDISTKVKEKYQ